MSIRDAAASTARGRAGSSQRSKAWMAPEVAYFEAERITRNPSPQRMWHRCPAMWAITEALKEPWQRQYQHRRHLTLFGYKSCIACSTRKTKAIATSHKADGRAHILLVHPPLKVNSYNNIAENVRGIWPWKRPKSGEAIREKATTSSHSFFYYYYYF